ncbi:MAG: flagellar FliJ family protein [Alphaproteobacteria bacterium]|nr:flagellar FliJ family protein [Alphaproteobacteria bacterium]
MADLTGLIRVRTHDLEQKQKTVAELYRQVEELSAQKTELLETLDAEQEKMKDFGVEMLSYFGPYSDAVHERVEEIDDRTTKLETRIEIAREDMRLAYAELKKIEITHERRLEEEREEEEKRETSTLDEIAIDSYLRHMKED